MLARPLFVLALACGLGVACGGGQPEPTAPTTTTVTSAPVETAPSLSEPPAASAEPAASASTEAPAAPVEKAWKDKNHDEKLAVMKTVVMPKMKALFQDHDSKEFKEFTCATCHGPGAKEGNFEMPNAKLPKLNAKDGFKKETKAHPKAMKFMMEKVVPEMATALNVAPFDPKTMTGFGCAGCHVVEH